LHGLRVSIHVIHSGTSIYTSYMLHECTWSIDCFLFLAEWMLSQYPPVL